MLSKAQVAGVLNPDPLVQTGVRIMTLVLTLVLTLIYSYNFLTLTLTLPLPVSWRRRALCMTVK